LAIYLAHSEGALIAIMVALLAFGFFASKASRITVLLFILAVSGILVVNTPIREKVFQKATLMDLSGQIRRQQWKETWQMLLAGHFFSGAGLSNYKQAILPYHQEGIFVNDGDPDFRRKIVIFDDKYRAEHWQPVEIYLYPHNLALNFWSEIGFFGMLVFFWIFFKAIFISFSDFRLQILKITVILLYPWALPALF
jgi:O-antigen ligase